MHHPKYQIHSDDYQICHPKYQICSQNIQNTKQTLPNTKYTVPNTKYTLPKQIFKWYEKMCHIKCKRELKMVPLMCNQHWYRYFDLYQPFSNTVRLLHDIWVYAICSFLHFFHFHCCPGKTGCDVKQGNYISSLKWKPS